MSKSEDSAYLIHPKTFLDPKPTRLQQRTLPFLAEPDEHDLAFYARAFVYTSLPHQQAEDNEWTGNNGALNLTLISPREIGLPYGRYPRLILAYLTTYAVKHQKATIPLGKSFSQFALSLGVSPSTGPRGTLTRLRDQLVRLLHLTVHCTWDDGKAGEGQLVADLQRRRMTRSYNLAAASQLWWNRDRTQGAIDNNVVLSTDFFDEITTRPLPFDLRVVQALESTLACDIYLWLTLRSIRAQRKGVGEAISWELLRAQFSSGIQHKGRFKAEFIKAIEKVLAFYPDVRATAEPHGLVLKPYPSHVGPKRLITGNP